MFGWGQIHCLNLILSVGTFLTEHTETTSVLPIATHGSLVLLDELSRGKRLLMNMIASAMRYHYFIHFLEFTVTDHVLLLHSLTKFVLLVINKVHTTYEWSTSICTSAFAQGLIKYFCYLLKFSTMAKWIYYVTSLNLITWKLYIWIYNNLRDA